MHIFCIQCVAAGLLIVNTGLIDITPRSTQHTTLFPRTTPLTAPHRTNLISHPTPLSPFRINPGHNTPKLHTNPNIFFYKKNLKNSAILYYDWLLTFDEEVIFFWSRRINLVTVLFFLNRYFSLFANVGVIFQSFRNWTPDVSVLFIFPLCVCD